MPADVFARTLANSTLRGLPTAPALGLDRTGLTDQTAAINAAIASQGMIEFPAGTNAGRYGLTGGLSITRSNVHLRFQGGAALVPVGAISNQMIDIRGTAPTVWVPLSANAYQNACVIQTATDPGWQVGDWLEVRADTVISSTPNYTSDNVGDCHKIAQKFGTGPCQWVFNEPLCEDFLTTANAVAGKATMLENIVIENPQFNDEDFSSTINFAIRAQYCAGLKIIRPTGYGSKLPFEADRTSGDFLKFINCIEPYIEDPCMTHGAYYGLSVMGWTRGLKSYGGTMTDVRHAVSVIQSTLSVVGTPGRIQQYGQPSDILVHGMTARNTALSSFDTHDTGFNIRFDSCTAYAAGDDGFQFRTPKVKAINCAAYGAANDGFSHNDMLGNGTGAADCELINCTAIGNGRSGVNFPFNRGLIRGGEFSQNGNPDSRPAFTYPPTTPPAAQGTIKTGACGIRINGGIIDGATIEGNTGTGGAGGSAIMYGDALAAVTMRPLLVRGVTAPANTSQTRFITLGSSTLNFGLITLGGGCQIDGYANKLFENLGVKDDMPPVSLGGNHITANATLRRGQATLAGGQVFVPNTAVRNKAAGADGEAILSRIDLNRIDAAGVPGSLYIKSILDSAGFTVASTAFAEPTRTNAIRNNTNVGAANGVVGSGGVLPTNWANTLGNANGIGVQVVGTGTETGPGGGTQNYIDVRFNGTASAALNYGIYLDAVTNPAAAAVAGETWTVSAGTLLTAGSMTNITSVNLGLFERTSTGASVTSSYSPIAPNTVKRRIAHTRMLTGGTTAFVAGYLQITANSGAVIDITLRLYMPQLEKASDASAPIATSGSAATRTQDPAAADNSTFEWIASI
jgi:hypothetical protein